MIDADVVEGQLLAVEADVFDGHAAGGYPLGGELAAHRRGVHGADPIDVLRVVGDVAAGSEPDFEDLAVEGGGRLLAELVDGLAPQGEVGDAREDLICVDAHEMRAAQRTCWRWATTRPVRPPSSASVVR